MESVGKLSSPTEQSSPIGQSLITLEKNMETLQDRLNSLQSKLLPILSPGETNKMAEPKDSTEIAMVSKLDAYTYLVKLMITQVEDLLDRCAL